jgi:hypothetical protein
MFSKVVGLLLDPQRALNLAREENDDFATTSKN